MQQPGSDATNWFKMTLSDRKSPRSPEQGRKYKEYSLMGTPRQGVSAGIGSTEARGHPAEY